MSIDKFDNLSATPPPEATKLASPPPSQAEKTEGITIDYLRAAEESLKENDDFAEIFSKIQDISKGTSNPETKSLAALFALFVSAVSLRVSSLEGQIESGMSDDVVSAFEDIEALVDEILAASEGNKPNLKALIREKIALIKDIVSSQLGEEED